MIVYDILSSLDYKVIFVRINLHIYPQHLCRWIEPGICGPLLIFVPILPHSKNVAMVYTLNLTLVVFDTFIKFQIFK